MGNKVDILFMGRKQVASDCLSFLLKMDSIRVVGVLTDSHLEGSATLSVALENNIPVLDHSSVRKLILSGDFKYDLGLSVLYWKRLDSAFIHTPKLGNINFHPAPLPDYKGTAGYNLAIMDELSKWGVTAHYMDENIDTGGIIEVSLFDINHELETAQSVESKTQPVLFDLFKKTTVNALGSENLIKTLPNEGGRYISRNEMESMKEVRDGDDIDKKIRAFWFPPYDGAWMKIGGKKVTLINRFILEKVIGTTETCLYDDKERT